VLLLAAIAHGVRLYGARRIRIGALRDQALRGCKMCVPDPDGAGEGASPPGPNRADSFGKKAGAVVSGGEGGGGGGGGRGGRGWYRATSVAWRNWAYLRSFPSWLYGPENYADAICTGLYIVVMIGCSFYRIDRESLAPKVEGLTKAADRAVVLAENAYLRFANQIGIMVSTCILLGPSLEDPSPSALHFYVTPTWIRDPHLSGPVIIYRVALACLRVGFAGVSSPPPMASPHCATGPSRFSTLAPLTRPGLRPDPTRLPPRLQIQPHLQPHRHHLPEAQLPPPRFWPSLHIRQLDPCAALDSGGVVGGAFQAVVYHLGECGRIMRRVRCSVEHSIAGAGSVKPVKPVMC
jgi:hypothetical protein